MAKTYEGDTTVVITLNLNKDLSNATRVLVRYRKPGGMEGYWESQITDTINGVVKYQFPSSSDGLDDSGFWTFWAYIYWDDGTVEPGDPLELAVYSQGKSYIGFPYGTQSGATQEITMAQEAYEITYDNTNSGLVATNVQDAVDELDSAVDNFEAPASSDVSYDNATSGLTATNVQAAIDEVDSNVDGIELLLSQANQVVYTDSSRTDTYTEDGTIHRPYKSLALAISSTTGPAVIKVSADTYTENIALPNNVSLLGMGIGKTVLTGTVQTGTTGNCSLKEMTIQDDMTIQCPTVVSNIECSGNVSISSDVKAYNFNVSSTVAHAVAVTAGLSIIENSILSTTDNSSAIVQNGGVIALDNVEVDNSAAASATVNSSGGTIRILSSTIKNAGGGLAADINNGATAASPNVLSNVIQDGGIEAGASYTVQEGVEGGDPTGTNFSKRPATQIGYDNATTGLSGDTTQAAIDEAYSSCKSGSGAPAYTPTNTPELFFDTTGNVLYIWNGTAWRQIATT